MGKIIKNPDGSRTRISSTGRKFHYRKFGEGGKVNTLEGDLISKVLVNRNQNLDFIQRAQALGEIEDTPMFNRNSPTEFGQKESHLMSWGEDNKGQAYAFPTIYNPNNEAIKVPNQYADYFTHTGYKKATGLSYRNAGRIKKSC